MATCIVCQQVKVEHQRLSSLLQTVNILDWKYDHISIDFVVGLTKLREGYNALWVIVG